MSGANAVQGLGFRVQDVLISGADAVLTSLHSLSAHLFTNADIELIEALDNRTEVDHGPPILLRLMKYIVQKQLQQISVCEGGGQRDCEREGEREGEGEEGGREGEQR